MIIKTNRGFNQTPSDIRDNINKQKNLFKKKEVKVEPIKKIDDPLKKVEALKKINRL